MSNAKPADVKAALAAAFMSTEMFKNTYTPVVLNTAGKLVLIDTGTGEAGFNGSKGMNGQFMNNLAAAGMNAGIDRHGDHLPLTTAIT